eukprot:g13755.t1
MWREENHQPLARTLPAHHDPAGSSRAGPLAAPASGGGKYKCFHISHNGERGGGLSRPASSESGDSRTAAENKRADVLLQQTPPARKENVRPQDGRERTQTLLQHTGVSTARWDIAWNKQVLGLVSGGKDSLFNLEIACELESYDVVCIGNLRKHTEIDSWMYQTVCTELVRDIAGAMGLPLLSREIRGEALNTELFYEAAGSSSDETEDLFILLSEAKRLFPDLYGVCSGAIFSDYQRLRVEAVCGRLGLVNLSFLWRIPQRVVLSAMNEEETFDAVLVKVCSMGLEKQHLGKSLREMAGIFGKLHEENGFHVCGEGGEYETVCVRSKLYTNLERYRRTARLREAEAALPRPVVVEEAEAAQLLGDCSDMGDETRGRDSDFRALRRLFDFRFDVSTSRSNTNTPNEGGTRQAPVPPEWTTWSPRVDDHKPPYQPRYDYEAVSHGAGVYYLQAADEGSTRRRPDAMQMKKEEHEQQHRVGYMFDVAEVARRYEGESTGGTRTGMTSGCTTSGAERDVDARPEFIDILDKIRSVKLVSMETVLDCLAPVAALAESGVQLLLPLTYLHLKSDDTKNPTTAPAFWFLPHDIDFQKLVPDVHELLPAGVEWKPEDYVASGGSDAAAPATPGSPEQKPERQAQQAQFLRRNFAKLSADTELQAKIVFGFAREWLEEHGFVGAAGGGGEKGRVLFVDLQLKNVAEDFGLVNALYSKILFGGNTVRPPSRCCYETELPKGVMLRLRLFGVADEVVVDHTMMDRDDDMRTTRNDLPPAPSAAEVEKVVEEDAADADRVDDLDAWLDAQILSQKVADDLRTAAAGSPDNEQPPKAETTVTHVQSISAWAMACIGPYSQAVDVMEAQTASEDLIANVAVVNVLLAHDVLELDERGRLFAVANATEDKVDEMRSSIAACRAGARCDAAVYAAIEDRISGLFRTWTGGDHASAATMRKNNQKFMRKPKRKPPVILIQTVRSLPKNAAVEVNVIRMNNHAEGETGNMKSSDVVLYSRPQLTKLKKENDDKGPAARGPEDLASLDVGDETPARELDRSPFLDFGEESSFESAEESPLNHADVADEVPNHLVPKRQRGGSFGHYLHDDPEEDKDLEDLKQWPAQAVDIENKCETDTEKQETDGLRRGHDDETGTGDRHRLIDNYEV